MTTPEKRYSTPECPEHGDLCGGDECCCSDKHPKRVPAPDERTELDEATIRKAWDSDGAADPWEVPFSQLRFDERETVCNFARRIFALGRSRAGERA
jgi:hypothetical protein